ncbi:Uncharacterised protein [Bordetella pertussis]|nr:Uncharacterised protein [Bordetella pertussis]
MPSLWKQAGSSQLGVERAPVALRKRNLSCVTGTFSGAPFSFQSGISSVRACGSMTAPDRICAPSSEPFSRTQTLTSWFFSAASCLRRMAAASPAGPPPTTTTSYSIDSRSDITQFPSVNPDMAGSIIGDCIAAGAAPAAHGRLSGVR